MHYTIDTASRESAYLQLYRQLRDDIVCGAYRYGERLPSKRLLATELGISVVTAQHALQILCDEGYAEARERSGFIVIFRRDDSFAASAEPSTAKMPPTIGTTAPFLCSIGRPWRVPKGFALSEIRTAPQGRNR